MASRRERPPRRRACGARCSSPSPLISWHRDTERDRGAGLEDVLVLDHRLVDLGPAVDVVGLDGQELLQDVRGAVGLERPHLHLAEALAAEARLAAQRLLRDQRVRDRSPGRAPCRRRGGAASACRCSRRWTRWSNASPVRPSNSGLLPSVEQPRSRQRRLDVALLGAVEHRRDRADAELVCAAQPRWVSRIWPTFMRLGTPSGLRTMSTGCRPRGTACPRRAGSWRSRPCCRDGQPSCPRPRCGAWWRRRP